jgi:hypothetical protein
MSDSHYDWQRWWCPRGGFIAYDRAGYVLAPESAKQYERNDLISFDNVADVHCLVLLGEPGIGKSRTLSTIVANHRNRGDLIHHIQLGSYRSDFTLSSALFDDSRVKHWLTSSGDLYLFLDGFDELLMHGTVSPNFIFDEIKRRNWSAEHLFLRITCRSAAWPQSIETKLESIWGQQQMRVLELAPLTRMQVAQAAQARHIEIDQFLEDLTASESIPLAIRPITLDPLLSLYDQHDELNASKTKLYGLSMEMLCEGADDRHQGKLSVHQRVLIAGRIAAIMQLSGQTELWIGPRRRVPSGEHLLSAQDLCNYEEYVNATRFIVDSGALNEVIANGPFSTIDANRVVWSHSTYSEYLAAWYLLKLDLGIEELIQIITHPDDPHKQFPIRLIELGAWLASLSDEFFERAILLDPIALLHADATALDFTRRKNLTNAILEIYKRKEKLDINWSTRDLYQKLSHPDLVQQLRPTIIDVAENIRVRQLAIEIAAQCRLQELEGLLADIALDLESNMQVRIQALRAISEYATQVTRARVKPIALGSSLQDDYEELKGNALRCVWPECISATELFATLELPKVSSYIGSYQAFIVDELTRYLRPRDVPIALLWIAQRISDGVNDFDLDHMAHSVCEIALDHLDDEHTLKAFAQYVESCVFVNRPWLGVNRNVISALPPQITDAVRRQIIVLIVERINGVAEVGYLNYSRPNLVATTDQEWLMTCVRSSPTGSMRDKFIQLLRSVAYDEDGLHFQDIYELWESDPLLYAGLANFFYSELDSPVVQSVRKYRETERQRLVTQSAQLRQLGKLVAECELTNDPNAYFRVDSELARLMSTRFELVSIDTLRGSAFAPHVDAIVALAKRYILETPVDPTNWLKVFAAEHKIHQQALTGLKAIVLSASSDPEWLGLFSRECWEIWLPVLMTYPITPHSDYTNVWATVKTILQTAYATAPEAFVTALEKAIVARSTLDESIVILEHIDQCWGNDIKLVLVHAIDSGVLTLAGFESVLRFALSHSSVQVLQVAKNMSSLPVLKEPSQRMRAVVVAQILTETCPIEGWPHFWAQVLYDRNFGRQVIERLAFSAHSQDRMFSAFSENDLAALYIWLEAEYPHSEYLPFVENDEAGMHLVSPSESIGQWKDRVLVSLQNFGTFAAANAIDRILSQFPHLTWLTWTREACLGNARQHVVHEPSKLIDLFQKHRQQRVNHSVTNIVHGDYIDARESQGLVNRPGGPVSQQFDSPQ